MELKFHPFFMPTNNTQNPNSQYVVSQPPVVVQQAPAPQPKIKTGRPLGYKVAESIWVLFSVLEALIGLRIIFLLLGAKSNGFTSFLYNFTDIFVVPFQGIFPSPGTATAYFDVAAVLAMVIYAVVSWGIGGLIRAISD